MRVKWLVLASFLIVSTIAVGCAPAKQAAQAPRAITIAGSSVGGTMSAFAIGASTVLNKHYPGVSWAARSGSSGANPGYITQGSVTLGLITPPNWTEIYGMGNVSQSRLRSLSFQGYLWYFWLFPKDSPWNRIEDVPKGTTIGAGLAGTFQDVFTRRWVEAVGLNPADYQWANTGKSDVAAAWRDGALKVFMASGALPNSFIIEAKNTKQGLKVAGVPPEQRPKFEQMGKEMGFAVVDTPLTKLDPTVFTRDAITIMVGGFLVSRDDFPEDMAYKVTSVLHDNHSELVEAWPGATDVTPENLAKFGVAPVEVHPGTAKYLKEKGFLK